MEKNAIVVTTMKNVKRNAVTRASSAILTRLSIRPLKDVNVDQVRDAFGLTVYVEAKSNHTSYFPTIQGHNAVLAKANAVTALAALFQSRLTNSVRRTANVTARPSAMASRPSALHRPIILTELNATETLRCVKMANAPDRSAPSLE